MHNLTTHQIAKINDLWERNWSIELIARLLYIREKYVRDCVHLYQNMTGRLNPKEVW